MDERAGQPATDADLVDVAALVTAYFAEHPDPAEPAQQVTFGTSGHRGSALRLSFNDDHIAATTQAICEYRAAAGITGPLFIGRDTHALSEPALVTALEVLAANDVHVLADSRDGYTPTPALSRAILAHNAGGAGGQADGIVVTPSHNPPEDGGFKYNPPDGGPAGTEITGQIQRRANELLPAGLREVQRIPIARARAQAGRFDFLGAYVGDAALRGRHGRDQGRRGADRRRPAGRCQRRLLGRDRQPLRARPDRRQPAWSTRRSGS